MKCHVGRFPVRALNAFSDKRSRNIYNITSPQNIYSREDINYQSINNGKD